MIFICLSVLLPVGYSHVGGGTNPGEAFSPSALPLSPEFRRITFLLPVSFHSGVMSSLVCFFGASSDLLRSRLAAGGSL